MTQSFYRAQGGTPPGGGGGGQGGGTPPPVPPPDSPPQNPPPIDPAIPGAPDTQSNAPMIRALSCAINVVRGSGGGYQPHERYSAADILEIEFQRLCKLERER